MLRVRINDQREAGSLCDFLRGVFAAVRRTSDPALIEVELPGALSSRHERREVTAYLATWQGLGRGRSAQIV